jgi:hypothetical protein
MAPRRKFSKAATFEIPGRGEGSVRVAGTGEVRLELPGRFTLESFFPGFQSGDAMNITLVPTRSKAVDAVAEKP